MNQKGVQEVCVVVVLVVCFDIWSCVFLNFGGNEIGYKVGICFRYHVIGFNLGKKPPC